MTQTFTPTTLADALALMAEHRANARVINGGTEPTPSAPVLIDLSQIPNLATIREDGDYIRLGASVTHAQVIASELMQARAVPLVRACAMFSSAQARDRGTLAGNIATAIPTNLTLAPLWALGAEVKLASVRGQRVVTFNDFFLGIGQTAQAPDELIVEIAMSKMSLKDKGAFLATGWSPDAAQANLTCAVVIEFEDDEISNAWINLGGVAPKIVNAIDAEQALVGMWLSDVVIDQAAELAMNAVVLNPDKSETVRALVTQALHAIAAPT